MKKYPLSPRLESNHDEKYENMKNMLENDFLVCYNRYSYDKRKNKGYLL